jgi:uroporphyrinogen decarboxylase
MTPKAYVIASLKHQTPGVIPYHADFTLRAHERMAAHTRDPNFADVFHQYLHGTAYSGGSEEVPGRKGFFKDAYGVTWNRSGADKDIGVIEAPVLSKPDMRPWREPALDEARLRQELQSVIAGADNRFTMGGIGFSMFERAWSLCGMENLLMYMIDEPAFVHELLDAICAYHIKIIDIAGEYPLNGFYFGDDWGQQRGLIMGPKLWRTFIKPRVRLMYERARQYGMYIIQHSCGDIRELLPDLIEMGLSCYQTFQPEIYDIEATKREFGMDLAFWGGISTQQLLAKATPDEVMRETSRVMGIMGKGGGYIAAPTHAVPGDVPPENILAMLGAFTRQS